MDFMKRGIYDPLAGDEMGYKRHGGSFVIEVNFR
jgi:hypothetical protein